MRGEQLRVILVERCRVGSSPHAWGTVADRLGLVLCQRFIPTCVGNSGSWGSPSGGPPVHPHMRGEQSALHNGLTADIGSSPHAWGTEFQIGYKGLIDRFIPTCVGNSHLRRSPQFVISVHPHMRGEQTTILSGVFMLPGSSPHAWGTVD